MEQNVSLILRGSSSEGNRVLGNVVACLAIVRNYRTAADIRAPTFLGDPCTCVRPSAHRYARIRTRTHRHARLACQPSCIRIRASHPLPVLLSSIQSPLDGRLLLRDAFVAGSCSFILASQKFSTLADERGVRREGPRARSGVLGRLARRNAASNIWQMTVRS